MIHRFCQSAMVDFLKEVQPKNLPLDDDRTVDVSKDVISQIFPIYDGDYRSTLSADYERQVFPGLFSLEKHQGIFGALLIRSSHGAIDPRKFFLGQVDASGLHPVQRMGGEPHPTQLFHTLPQNLPEGYALGRSDPIWARD